MLRLSLTILLILSAVALPWWAGLVFLIFSLFFFSWYYEGALATLSYELVYGLASQVFWLTIIILLTVPMVEWLKKRLYVFH